MSTNVFPTSPSDLAARPDVLMQIRQAYESFRSQAESNPDVIEAFLEDPANAFLEYAPEQLRAGLSEAQVEEANAVLLGSAAVGRLQGIVSATDAEPGELMGEALLESGWGSAWCEIGLWSAIVLALGAAIAVSQGAAIAPLIALDAGILPVLAAITGLSEGAIAAMAAAGGFTFGKLIEAACE